MTVDELLAATQREMKQRSDPEFRESVRNIFAEPVDPWGVRSRDLKAVEQMVYRELKAMPLADRNKFCSELWKGGKLEDGSLVCHVYRRFAPKCGESEFKLFEQWIDKHVRNWAHCDGVSSWLLGASIANVPALKANLTSWTRSPNRWKRRSAAVALLQEAKNGRSPEHIFWIAGSLAHDKDQMVQKGVGWLLKVTYSKRPEAVVAFLEEMRLPLLVVRYAAEKMSAADKAKVSRESRSL